MNESKLEKLKKHGGNVKLLAKKFGLNKEEVIDFSSNINPYGPPSSVSGEVKRAVKYIGDYPEQEAESLVEAISNHLEIDSKHIVAGNGSIELIYMLPQVLKPKRALLVVPSFTEYELSLHKAGTKVVYKNALAKDIATKAIKRHVSDIDIDMAMIGNPNNPCGYLIEKDVLLEAIDSNPRCTWVIDEAFIDFTDSGLSNSLTEEATTRENLAVLRSLTKIYSIAGLRLGYMIASEEMTEKIRKAKYPWSVNSMAIMAGIAALKDKDFVKKSVSKISNEAKRLFSGLANIDGLYPFKPSANYILVRIEKAITAARLQEMLLRRGFAIRDCSSYTGMDDYYFRVAVRRPDENDQLVDVLRDILS